MSFIKKILFSYLLSIILTTALFANKIDLTTHGRLSLGYFGNSFGFLNTSAFGLNAYVMADFGITEHWSIGMGATGIWNIWSLFPFNNIMTSIGDVSDIYILYKNDNFKIIIGRFNASQGKTEMIANGFFNGPLQGVAVFYKTSNATTLWFNYINSWLNNGFMSGRIGSDLKGLSPYFADGKITIGGEVLMVGEDIVFKIQKGSFLVSPWVLLNTKAPDGTTRVTFDPIAQIGSKFNLQIPIHEAWQSITSGDAIFQYGNGTIQNDASDDFLGYVNVDEEIKYTRYRLNTNNEKYVDYSIGFGVGVRAVIAKQTGRFFALNDSTRFYGQFLNNAIYGTGNTWTAYVFSKMEHRFFDVHLLIGGGTYSEVSLIGAWKAYRKNRLSNGQTLGFDIGAGYSFANGNNAANHALMVFGKIAY